MAEPFIFPSEATQVFFTNIVDTLGWKVVSQKKKIKAGGGE